MALTVRKEIVEQMIYRLEQAGSLVTVCRHRDTAEEPFDPSECPAVNIIDAQGKVTHETSYDEHALDVRLSLHTTSRTPAADVDSLMGDVLDLVEQNGTWGGKADGTTVDSHDLDLTVRGETIESATLDLTVHYTTPPGRA